ncbi:hypothetical protein CHLNCDRAFT_56405 [Chlorella variabilis]|uniref:Acetyl-coenzyme A synthetase n=1 Tax=Chlorella variabilis TaxID=554065 RepID=E1ZSG1_CHLVA|nr:hypothetical protein CHLNCDRAFT_56405 [Chlorella variabilis]EFN51239.1 hypothetical protein CHLNCDRAFT_56405 [Chlorella variabilis]|eukprot:XP_005843341.1 hypothetical protein CHLNCDRAFT_56405 [Chlorella variabilis]
MSAADVYSPAVRDGAYIKDKAQYDAMYQRSVEDPNGKQGVLGRQLVAPERGRVYSEWFKGGRTNMSYNCLDRHVAAEHGDQTCFLFEGNEPGRDGAMTYKQVLDEVCRVANWLRGQGVRKGDFVCIYMPMICELPIAMLACARIGAIHAVVFGGFSAEALAGRIEGCHAKVLITCSAVMRGPKPVGLKSIADEGLRLAGERGHSVPHVLVFQNDDAGRREDVGMEAARDVFWQDAIPAQPPQAEVEWVEAEHPLFLLFTSGSTGKPKGVVHATGGLMVYAGITTKYVFAVHPGDTFWCTADCGWVTGHSYVTYGPLLERATCVVFEGVPTYPTPSRCWEVVDKLKVKQFYTAPTLIRSLMRFGDEPVKAYERSSLRILGSVVGDGACPVVDTWWQTETGGHMIVNLPTAWPEKPGSATFPFFGVVPVVCDEKGNELQGECEGILCIKSSWPSAIRGVFGDQKRFEETYYQPFPGYYFSGDGVRRDADGYFWITGRVDDVINVSGHRIGTAEVESALVGHHGVAEAAVVGYSHPIKGQGIWAYVTLVEGVEYSDGLKKELVAAVRSEIGPFAAPDVIHWAPGLPKTRSGKIMRRVLRKIAANKEHELGDTSTLADPGVVQTLIEMRGK